MCGKSSCIWIHFHNSENFLKGKAIQLWTSVLVPTNLFMKLRKFPWSTQKSKVSSRTVHFPRGLFSSTQFSSTVWLFLMKNFFFFLRCSLWPTLTCMRSNVSLIDFHQCCLHKGLLGSGSLLKFWVIQR